MNIRTYNAAQLNEFIRSDEFHSMPVIPISTPRAISHIRNPRAAGQDVLLIIAREGEEMVGYLGVLPDMIYNEKGEALKCGWLSCMWVNPALRGKGIAKKLIATAFDKWDDHILVTEFTPEAKGLYDRSGHFQPLRSSEGLRCYLRFNLHEVLPKKNVRYKKIAPLLALADGIANIPVDIKLRYLTGRDYGDLVFEPVTTIDSDIAAFITPHLGYSFEKRSKTELDWIMSYPWLVTSDHQKEGVRYHFSVTASRFENIFLKIMDGPQLKGFVHLTIRDTHLKVPYAYFPDALTRYVVNYICDLMIRRHLNMLTVFHRKIVASLRDHASAFIYKRKIGRHYIITNTLASRFSGFDALEIQDGDADCAFT